MQTFAEIISDRRMGMPYRQFAKRIGVSSATLSRVEKGGEPDIVTFFTLCRALHLRPEVFEEQYARQSLKGKSHEQ